MQNQIAFAIGRFVNSFTQHSHTAKTVARNITKIFIMVAGNVNYACALSGFAQ